MEKIKIAIVTGASSGLGREFVRMLNKESDVQEIWAIARNDEKLSELKKEFGEKVRTFLWIYQIENAILN